MSAKNEQRKFVSVDPSKCTGCGICVKACFMDVMRWDKVKKKPVVAYEQDCVWCFTCEINCPVQCINVIPNVTGQPVAPF